MATSSSAVRPAYYPAMLDLAGRDALLVGGGEVAAQKAAPLIDAGVRLRIVAPKLCAQLRRRVDAGEASWEEREAQPEDVDGAAVVVCATDQREVNRRISAAAAHAGIPVNVVDDPELCSFIAPAVIRRGGLQLAISTQGRSPAFAKFVRLQVEQAIGDEYAQLGELAGRLRDRSRAAGLDYAARDRLATGALPRLLELLRAGDGDAAEAWCDAAIADFVKARGVAS